MMDWNIVKQTWEHWKNVATSWLKENAKKYITVGIPRERTVFPPLGPGEDKVEEPVQLKAYESYFRIWLSEMFLGKSVNWFQSQYPAVHATVNLKYGGRDGVLLSHVAKPPNEVASKGVFMNYKLTDLLPFNGGTVEIAAALQALNGKNYLDSAIGILGSFSKLVSVPLTPALSISEKISSGIRDLSGTTNGSTHLAFHDTYTSGGAAGGNPFRTGYVAVVLAPVGTLAEDQFSVDKGRLLYSGAAFTGYDYLLLRIEGRKERDDWRLQEIDEAIKKAKTALVQEHAEEAKGFRATALIAAHTSPDLAENDRNRVAKAIKQELAEAEKNGAVAGTERDLKEIVRLWGNSPAARERISLEELLAE